MKITISNHDNRTENLIKFIGRIYEENIQSVQTLVKIDNRDIIQMIIHIIGKSIGSVENILKETLSLSKL